MIFMGAVSFLGGHIYKLSAIRIIQTACLVFFGSALAVFTREYLREEKTLAFVFSFAVAALLSLFFPSIPAAVWPFMPVFALLTIVSSYYTGLISSVTCLIFTVLLSGNGNMIIFFAYMMTGLVASLIVSGLDEEFRVTGRLLVGIASLGFMLCWGFIMPSTDTDLSVYIMPLLNLIFSLIILVIILKTYSQKVVRKEADIYTALADTECELLKRIRKTSEAEYRHALSVSYFCDRAGRKAGLYMPLVKCSAFYHRAGIIYGSNNVENMERVASEFFFPPELKELLVSYVKDKNNVRSKYSCILMLSDTVVSTVEYMMSQKLDSQLEYSNIIHGIFASKLKKTALSDSELTYHDMNVIEKMFVDEQFYFEVMKKE
ncbi:MAG: hypothetical protein K6E33_09790 [Lachnospiraceae bacterium]|nr:hypothetical protein [Lachnospiraceae bacterium]